MPDIDLPDGLSDTTVIIIVVSICITAVLVKFITKLNKFPNIFKHSDSSKLDRIMLYLSNDKQRIDDYEKRFEENDKKWGDYVLSHKELGDDIKDTRSRLSAKIDNTDRKVDELSDMILDMRLSAIRKDLFAEPQSKEEHENLIKEGDWYCAHGGNGVGAILLKNIKESFRKRSMSHDWDYSHKV